MFYPQEYKVDGQAEIKQPIGMYGGRLEAKFSCGCRAGYLR